MTISRQNLEGSTVKLTITIPQKRVAEIREQVLKTALAQVEVPGFRKGKAPKKLAEEKLDKKKLVEQAAAKLVPEAYQEAIQKENIKPIVNPQIKLLSALEDKDWQIEVLTCEAPEIKLEEYKEEIKKVNAAGKIWTPGTAETRKKKGDTESKEERLQKILNALLSREAAVPALLIENELNRRLSTLINKTEKLGMTLEQYLTSTNQTAESLRENYKKSGEEFWKLELILNKIADEEKISVDQAEIDKVINQTKNEKEKKALENQKYFLAQVLRRQKTLDFLLGL